MKDGLAPDDELIEAGNEANGPDAPEREEPLVFEEPLDAAIRERDELKALVQRVQADFVNYRNRVAVEREEIRLSSTRRLAVRVLDSVDQFESALGAERPDGVEDSWFEGFDGIRRSLLQVLSSEGIEPYEATGDLFDPRLHEALLTAESDEVPASTVLMVLRRGYKMNDEVIRVAQVQISKAPSDSSPEPSGEEE
ncbi:MAG: nucleotide exchange factor GrpE [Dehalococcoidia bacterium]